MMKSEKVCLLRKTQSSANPFVNKIHHSSTVGVKSF